MIEIRDADHRKFPRRTFEARVRIHDHIRNRDVDTRAIDVNPMGMAVESRAFTMGETVSVRFPSPGGAYNLHVNGQVVRIEERPGKKPLVGIEFFDIEEWIFDELCAYVYEERGQKPLVLVLTDAVASR